MAELKINYNNTNVITELSNRVTGITKHYIEQKMNINIPGPLFAEEVIKSNKPFIFNDNEEYFSSVEELYEKIKKEIENVQSNSSQ